ncbi:MAG: hypothetical protein HYX53_08670 [Chloroflexi bacterium]|nr:hypothetical protein [Chloroflexota bacterium]
MSELQKKIGRIQRRETTGGFGFGAAARPKPRAMLLGVLVADGAAAKAAIAAGADVAIIDAASAAAAVKALKPLDGAKATAGARLPSLDEPGAAALREAGCDFVVCTLDGTASSAVDTDRMGHVVVADSAMDDTTLRALGPLGLDALFVQSAGGDMTLANQLQLVRIASFASTPLLVTIPADTAVSALRVLRDSGAAMVVALTGTTAGQIATLGEALQAVPPSKRAGRDGREMAMVPAAASAGDHEHGDDDDDDDGDDGE